MAQPTAYVPASDFSDHSTNFPTTPQTGTDMDTEFANVKTTTDEILTNIALIQRDDGELKNESVHVDAFTREALIIMGGSWTPQGEWATATAYVGGDVVQESSNAYVCAVAHTSGVFGTDVTSEYWININGGSFVLSDGTVTLAKLHADLVVDEDAMGSDSATKIPTQQSVKAYVDAEVAAAGTLDFQADSGSVLEIVIGTETITFTGGTGITSVGSVNDVTFNIDSTVATLTGSQTLENKIISAGIFTNQSLFADGGAAAPSVAFANDPDSGGYRVGADRIGFSVGGVHAFEINGSTTPVNYMVAKSADAGDNPKLEVEGTDTDSGLEIVGLGTGGLVVPVGALATPSVSFSGDEDTGGFRYAANSFGISTGGVLSGMFDDGGVNMIDGSAAAPSYSFYSAAGNIGMYRVTTDVLGFAVAGADVLRLGADGVYNSKTGTAALPAWSFTDDEDSGLFRIDANRLGLSVAGATVIDMQESAGTLENLLISRQSGAVDITAGGVTNTSLSLDTSGTGDISLKHDGTEVVNIDAGAVTLPAATDLVMGLATGGAGEIRIDQTTDTIARLKITRNGNSGVLAIHTGTVSGEAARIAADGKVNLYGDLDVAGDTVFQEPIHITHLGVGAASVRLDAGAGNDYMIENNGGTLRFRNMTLARDDFSIAAGGGLTFGSAAVTSNFDGATLNMNDNVLLNPKLKGEMRSVNAQTINSATLATDFDDGVQHLTLNATTVTTWNVTNWPASGTEGIMHCIVDHGAQSGGPWTLPVAIDGVTIKWAIAAPAVVTGGTPTASRQTRFALSTIDGGTSIYGSVIYDDIA